MKKLTRWIPLIIIIIAIACVFYFRLYEYVSFSTLEKYHAQLKSLTQHYYVIVLLIFMLVYIVAVSLSIPGATILTITGGYLFGYFMGTLTVVICATIGATILFLAVKTALGDWLEKKAGGAVKRMEKGFQENAFNYLLFLRLIPLFPFWVVNIVPALLDVRLRTFVLATFIGIVPGTFVYISVGEGLGTLLAQGKTPDLGIIFKPSILIPIIGLGILSLVPIVYKKFKNKRKGAR